MHWCLPARGIDGVMNRGLLHAVRSTIGVRIRDVAADRDVVRGPLATFLKDRGECHTISPSGTRRAPHRMGFLQGPGARARDAALPKRRVGPLHLAARLTMLESAPALAGIAIRLRSASGPNAASRRPLSPHAH